MCAEERHGSESVPEQTGLAGGLRQPGDGPDYLRRLKGNHERNAAGRVGTAKFSATAAAPRAVERAAASPRYACSGSVEFRTEGSDVRMWGTLTDISLHGCYVEMTTTFPVDTQGTTCAWNPAASGSRPRPRSRFLPVPGHGNRFYRNRAPRRQLRLKQILAPLAEQEPAIVDLGLSVGRRARRVRVEVAEPEWLASMKSPHGFAATVCSPV